MKNKKLIEFIEKISRQVIAFTIQEVKDPSKFDYNDRQILRSLNKIINNVDVL